MNFLRRHRKVRIALISSTIFLALFTVYRVALDIQLNRAMGDIRASGEPSTPEDLNAWRGNPVPDEENGALLWLEISERLNVTDDRWHRIPAVGGGHFPPPDQPIPQDVLQTMEDTVEANLVLLPMIRKASEHEAFRYRPDESAFERSSIFVYHLIGLVSFMLKASVHTATLDDPELASHYLVGALKCAASLRGELLPKSLEIYGNLVDEISVATEQILGRGAFDAEQLDRIADAYRTAESETWWSRIAVSQRAIALDELRQRQTYEAQRNGTFWLDVLIYDELPVLGRAYYSAKVLSGKFQREQLEFLRIGEVYLRQGNEPGYEDVDGTAEQFEIDRQSSLPGVWPRLRVYFGVRTRGSSFGTAIWSIERRAMALLRCGQMACAVEKYRLANGRLPNKLSELAPNFIEEIPQDPYTGKPLLYTPASGLYTLYSVARNLVDEGGIRQYRRGQALMGDLTLEVVAQ